MKAHPHHLNGMLLVRAASLFTSTREKILERYGLTQTSWGVLAKIFRQPGQSTHALAEMCLLTDQSFGQIVARLAKRGLVKRTPTFGRAIVHEVTPEGKELLTELRPLLDAEGNEFFSVLNREEMAALGELLERIVMAKGNETLKQMVIDDVNEIRQRNSKRK